MGFGLLLSAGSIFRKNAVLIFVPTLAVSVAAFGIAQFVFPESSNEDALSFKPMWVGGLARAPADPRTPSNALTSASYLLPLETPESAIPANEPACPSEASCPAKVEKISHASHKPQPRLAAATPAPIPAKRQVIASAQEVRSAEAAPQDPKPQAEAPKSSGWLDWSKISEKLPKTDTLLKPFGVVSDAVTGLIKRF